jgi:hypothetical protein
MIMSNEVKDLLDALHEGKMTLEDVAGEFKERIWPERRTPPPATYAELAADDLADPDPYIPGSYDDVVAAYDRGRLTTAQYTALADAIAESIRTHGQTKKIE